MKKLDEIRENAEKELIERLSKRCLEVLLIGGDFRLEKGELEDDWHEIKDDVADQFTPRDNMDVRKILSESSDEIEETYDYIKEEIDPTFGKDSNQFIPMMKTVIFHNISADMHYNAHNIFWKTTDRTMELLADKFDKDRFNDKSYIVELIIKKRHGYPILFASDEIKDDPEVIKLAINKEKWLFDYVSPRLYEMAKKSTIEDALDKDMLRVNLSEDLNTPKKKASKKNKI